MRRLTLIVLAVVAWPAAVDAGHARPCPAGKSVLQSTASAVLYETDEVVGCHRATGRRTYLTSTDGYVDVDPPMRMAGRFVAAQRTECPRDSERCSSVLAAWDLSTGAPPKFYEGDAADAEIKSNGTLAAIAERDGRWTVFLERWSGRETVLDRGAGIDPHSLSRDGRHVRWTHGAETRRARFR